MALLRFTQFIGLIISLVGMLIASPPAVRHVTAAGRSRARRAAAAVRRALVKAMWWRAVDHTIRVRSVVQGGGTATATLTATGAGGPPAVLSLEDRVRDLEVRWTRLNEEVAAVRATANEDRAAHQQALTAARDALAADISSLRARVSKNEQSALQTDAHALPVAVVGLLVVTFAAGLAAWRFPFWLLAIMTALAFTAAMARGAWRANPPQPADA